MCQTFPKTDERIQNSLVETLTVNQDDLDDARLLASSFPSTSQCDITQAISATKLHQVLKEENIPPCVERETNSQS